MGNRSRKESDLGEEEDLRPGRRRERGREGGREGESKARNYSQAPELRLQGRE